MNDNAGESESVSATRLAPVLFAALLSMICFFTSIIIIPQVFSCMAIGAAETGYFLSFISLVAVGAAAMMPRLIARLREYGNLYTAFSCYAAGHFIFSFADNVVFYIAGGVLMSCGFGLSVPLVNHMTVEQSHARVRGRNLAWLSMAIFSGQFLSSFMEIILGDSSVVFRGTATIAVAVIVALMVIHRKRRFKTA
ncbi:TPA: MFS transporter [Klebsiella michiganensis]